MCFANAETIESNTFVPGTAQAHSAALCNSELCGGAMYLHSSTAVIHKTKMKNNVAKTKTSVSSGSSSGGGEEPGGGALYLFGSSFSQSATGILIPSEAAFVRPLGHGGGGDGRL